MTPQVPSEGIMKTHDFDNAFSYKLECSCGNPDDSVLIFIEKDNDTNEFFINFSATQKTHWWKSLVDWEIHKIDNPFWYMIVNFTQSFINGLHQRLRITKDIWWNGYVEYSSDTIISKQTALNLAEALKTSIMELDKK